MREFSSYTVCLVSLNQYSGICNTGINKKRNGLRMAKLDFIVILLISFSKSSIKLFCQGKITTIFVQTLYCLQFYYPNIVDELLIKSSDNLLLYVIGEQHNPLRLNLSLFSPQTINPTNKISMESAFLVKKI